MEETKVKALQQKGFALMAQKWCLFLIAVLTLHSVLPGMERILIIHPDEKEFNTVVNGIKESVHKSMFIHEFVIQQNTPQTELSRKINAIQPKLIVLMDTLAVNKFKKYQMSRRPDFWYIPSIACMAAFANKKIQGLKNATVISHEISIATAVKELK